MNVPVGDSTELAKFAHTLESIGKKSVENRTLLSQVLGSPERKAALPSYL